MAKFICWCTDLGSTADDGKLIEALDAESAAEKWARREDCESADYWIVGGKTARVLVQDKQGGVPEAFNVTGETVAKYRARPVRAAIDAAREAGKESA